MPDMMVTSLETGIAYPTLHLRWRKVKTSLLNTELISLHVVNGHVLEQLWVMGKTGDREVWKPVPVVEPQQ